MEKNNFRAILLVMMIALFLFCFPVSIKAEEGETMPREYGGFLESFPDSVRDALPEGVLSDRAEQVSEGARQLSDPTYLLSAIVRAFASGMSSLMPTLLLLFGIVILAAVIRAVGEGLSGALRGSQELCVRLCTFCATAALAVSSLERLRGYFETLFASVATFLPLSALLYAMGGNLTAASAGTTALSTILTVCQLLCSQTVIPVFCLCLALSLLSVFEEAGAVTNQSLSSTVKKWYATALGLVMTVLTTALGAGSILSAKADGVAMKGVKMAVSSFVPVTGGTVSSTLGTLAASVELLRGSVGVVGIIVILLMLIPVVVELALLRGVYSLAAFLAGSLGCGGEQKLLGEIGGLYGYLEGIAALCTVVFLVAMGVFATAVSGVRA